MNINNKTIKITLLIVSQVLPQFLSAQVDPGVESPDPLLSDSLNIADARINLVLQEIYKERSTGSVNYIDAESEFMRDSRSNVNSAINGKVPGVFDSYNIWGTGNAVVVVDGVRQDAFYYESLNLMEVESIVVLKDAISKALYGAQGDQGVVLINTKRGIAGAQKIRVSGEYSLSQQRALPDYLNAADYMVKYNEAQLNDGVDASSLKFDQDLIDATRLGSDRTRYPDNDFYTDEYLRNFRTDVNVFADVTGGNEDARYYVSSGWGQSNGLLNTINPDKTNQFNFRGNLDFKINQYVKMGVDASARLSLSESPNINVRTFRQASQPSAENVGDMWYDTDVDVLHRWDGRSWTVVDDTFGATLGSGALDYWGRFASILPNAYPVLWDPSIIVDPLTRDMVLSEANLIDGKVLGGSSSFANNQIRGDLAQNGLVRYQRRNIQFGGKLDIDLSFITEGLAAKAYAGMNFYNSLFTQQDYEYAIYEPVFNDSTGLCDTVNIHGVDRPSNQYNTNEDNSDSYRQITYYGNLSYQRSFGQHDVSAVGVIYGDQITNNGMLQKDVLFHTGLSANYMYNNRYVAEFSAMGIGTRKLPADKRIEMAPSFGLAWIVSEEDFMDKLSIVDYLKLRASYGISKNDNWDNYYLYMNTFGQGGTFNYYNGTHNNQETLYASVENDIHLQKREDISVGLDASMFKNALNVELGYFISTSLDNITLRSSTFPQLMGFEDLIFNNYNSNKTQGIELGMNYIYKVSEDFSATLGGNLLHITPKITQYEEPVYDGADVALQREGTATDAMWALVAEGLYGEGDFNPDGTLADGLPAPTFGAVQPGDIKYLDQNGDGVIDQKDQRIAGNGIRTQYSVYLDIRYKNLGFYVLGIGRFGDSNYRTGSYFRVLGDIKYSEYAMQAYGPGNKDVNALHPRLTTNSGGHSDRNSSYWVFQNNSFTLPTMQLTYHFEGKNRMSFLKPSRVYVRAGNMVVLGKNKEYTEVSPNSAPKTRSIVMGLVTSF